MWCILYYITLFPYLEVVIVGDSNVEIDPSVLWLDRPVNLNGVDPSRVHQELAMPKVVDALCRVVVHVLANAVKVRPVEQHALQVRAPRVPARLEQEYQSNIRVSVRKLTR